VSDVYRLGQVAGAGLFGVVGLGLGGPLGAGAGLTLGLLLFVARWRGLTPWSWAALWMRRNRRMTPAPLVTVGNDRSTGGVRYQDGTVVAAVQLLGRAHQPTLLDGPGEARSANVLALDDLLPLMRQSLGLRIESMSVVCAGSRRQAGGDYPQVYDTLIGTSHYAGQREAWLIVRIRCIDNGDALGPRITAGTAALAAAQRVASALRCAGVRARVATATDITDLERRLGMSGLQPPNRGWRSVRADSSFLTTYACRPCDIGTATLAGMWSLRGDGIIQNLTIFGDGRACATVTVRTARPPAGIPATLLRTLPGRQAQALAANFCGPRPSLPGVALRPLPPNVVVGIGPSGVLLGKLADGSRMALPLGDPSASSHIQLAADDTIAKRVVIRAAATGERITVHTVDPERWASVRMANVTVIGRSRPDPGTTISVVDGSVVPAPRPATVISVGEHTASGSDRADIVIAQTDGPDLRVHTDWSVYDVEMELFRAENRYAPTGLLIRR